MMYSLGAGARSMQAEAKEIERADAVKTAEAVNFGVNIARYCKKCVWIFLIKYLCATC